MILEEFTNLCPRNVSILLKERKPKNLEKLAQMAEQYRNALNEKLSIKTLVAKQDVKDAKFGDLEALDNMTRRFAFDGRSHKAL